MVLKPLLVLLFIGQYFQHSNQISTSEDPSYNAGVVEFALEVNHNSAKDNVKNSLSRMKKIIESEETKDLDILVFPEGVLNTVESMTYVPDPEKKIAPCDIPDYANFLNELSCTARSRKLYVVINLVEKEECAVTGYRGTCDRSGLNKYNTNVVFDREGRVISRYRKTHLYRNEWQRYNVLTKPEHAIFTTDFGVTFGHFICFDMLFYDPALYLVQERNITDIIYPTFWFSELPFLTANQLQESWAFANDVNLLAADGSVPETSNSGSGIYAGKFGRLAVFNSEVGSTMLMKAKVPKRNRRSENQIPPQIVPQFTPQLETQRFTKFYLLRDYNVDIFTTKLLDADFTNVNETVCHGSFCCNFDIRRQFIASSYSHSAYRYRLVAYDGTQTTFQRIDPSEISVCSLVACTNEELYSCGTIFPQNVLVGNKYYFASISVKGSFRNTPRRLIHPSTVDGVLMPLLPSMFKWQEDKKATTTEVTMNLINPKSDILTFGIWTNHYSTAVVKHNLDYFKNGGQSSFEFSHTAFVLVILILYLQL